SQPNPQPAISCCLELFLMFFRIPAADRAPFESARLPLKRQRPIVFSLVTLVLAFASPGSAQQLQRPVSGAAVGIVGTFEAVHLDDFENKRSTYIYSVKDSATNRRFELH